MPYFLLVLVVLMGGVKARGEVIYTNDTNDVKEQEDEKKYFVAAAESNVRSYSFGEQLANAEQNVVKKIAVSVVDASFNGAIAGFLDEYNLNPKLFGKIHKTMVSFVEGMDHSVLERLDIFQKSEDALWLKVRVDSQKIFQDFMARRKDLEARLYKVNLKRKDQYLMMRLVDMVYAVVQSNLESVDGESTIDKSKLVESPSE